MALTAGACVGPYEIVGVLGAGGMGEVYRAHDTKLARNVALKVLPEAFATDAERMGRLRREAKVLASLNHPNIASIYGFEDSGGVHALVMELVEGPTLAERIAGQAPHGAIPVDEALPIARQVAEALEYAHERGIVHRDLKPANVKITRDGAVKLLDFGLAKAMEGDAVSASDISSSPTISRMATEAGLILGTAAYMAPEQAKGKAVDRRADIWAFGCVLYEMLSGRHAFDGETVTDVLAAVVRDDPDWTALPAGTPAPIRDLLHRCLTKEPKQRIRDIGDARILVEETQTGAGTAGGFGPAAAKARAGRNATWRRAASWVLAGLAMLVAAITVAPYWTATQPAAVMRFTLAPPTDGDFARGVASAVVLSPDGTQLVSVLHAGEKDRLYLRRLDRDQTIALPGTEGAFAPFFSPDGQWVAFFAEGKLKKVAVTGGLPVTLCDAADARGGDWGPDNIVLFTPTTDSPLERVSALGGTPEPVTKLTSAQSDSRSHRWPWFLPGGKYALFNVVYREGNPLDHSDIGVVSLATGEYRILIRGGSYPRYVSAGYLVYVVGTDLVAVPFDARTLEVTGTPVAMVRGVRTAIYSGSAEFSFSSNGTLAYLATDDRPEPVNRLVWVDRKGVAQPITTTVHAYASPRVLPDGKRIVVERRDQPAGIWLYDATRNTLNPLAVGGGDTSPALTPDGRNVIYNSVRNGREGLWMKRVDGSGGEENLTATTIVHVPNSASPDGKSLAYSVTSTTQNTSLLVLPLEGDHTPRPLLPGSGNRAAAAYSPDGRWIAYVSDQSGRAEVYVGETSDAGGTWPVSSGGGAEPVWARSGRELFYRAGNKMMVVAVQSGPAFSIGRALELFEGAFAHNEGRLLKVLSPNYDASPDGEHFVMIQPAAPAAAAPAPSGLHVVLNWFRELGGKGNGGTLP